jgi:hypothetical protein
MWCFKTGNKCEHDHYNENLAFVIMPFDGFNSVYDSIQQAIKEVENKKLGCERADTEYTTFNIWCSRICSKIKSAKYIIADTTGLYANVFYELGFAHNEKFSRVIIITQNINDAPFDIRDMNHIVYNEKDLPKLRKELIKAINSLEMIEDPRAYKINPGEKIGDIKIRLIEEQIKYLELEKRYVNAEARANELSSQLTYLNGQIKY